MPSAQPVAADTPPQPSRHPYFQQETRPPYRRFDPREVRIMEAFYSLGLTDAFIAAFLRSSKSRITAKRIRSGIFRTFDEIRAEPTRYQFRMTREAREHLDALEGPDSWLCQCVDVFPQFVTSYAAVDAQAAGTANDSR